MLATILIGFVIGVLAKFLYPGRDKLGFIFTTLLGIGGAVVAGHPCCLQPHDRKTLNRKKAV